MCCGGSNLDLEERYLYRACLCIVAAILNSVISVPDLAPEGRVRIRKIQNGRHNFSMKRVISQCLTFFDCFFIYVSEKCLQLINTG